MKQENQREKILALLTEQARNTGAKNPHKVAAARLGGGRPKEPLLPRFMSFVRKVDSGCWKWTGALDKDGYGFFKMHPKMVKAHRTSYELFREPIPSGKVIDHLCRHPWCVNPDHLEVVDVRTNTMRGISITAKNAKKTHCPKGHPFRGKNLRTSLQPNGLPRRHCRTCARAACRQWWLKGKRAPEQMRLIA